MLSHFVLLFLDFVSLPKYDVNVTVIIKDDTGIVQ